MTAKNPILPNGFERAVHRWMAADSQSDSADVLQYLEEMSASEPGVGIAPGWVLARASPQPALARTFTYLLGNQNYGDPDARLAPLLDLMWFPPSGDPSTLINLSTAVRRAIPTMQSESLALLGLGIPHLVKAAFSSVPLAAEAAVNLLVELEEHDLFAQMFGPMEKSDIANAEMISGLSPEHLSEFAALRERLVKTRRKPGVDPRFSPLLRFQESLQRLQGAAENDEVRAVLADQRCLFERHLREWGLLADARRVDTQVHQLRVAAADTADTPSFDLVARVIQLWQTVVGSFASSAVREPTFWPLATANGSFVINLAVQFAPALLKEALQASNGSEMALGGDADSGVPAAWYDLWNTLAKEGLRVECSIADPRAEPHRVSIVLAPPSPPAPNARKGVARWKRDLRSNDVPQADRIERVFLVTEIIGGGGQPTAEELGIEPRQVDYYLRAAISLALLNEQRQLTVAGQRLVALEEAEKMALAAVLFETSKCGGAWTDWAKATSLADVEPNTAAAFLADTVEGLNSVTAGRRAKTLVSWHNVLMPYHYRRQGRTTAKVE